MNTRLKKFQAEAYARGANQPPSPKLANLTKAFFELYADRPLAERQARAYAYALENEPVYIHPHTRIAGQIYQMTAGAGCPEYGGSPDDPRWDDFAVVPNAMRCVREALPANTAYARFFGDGGYPGHICWDFGLLLKRGIRGQVARCRKAAAGTRDPQAHAFYAGVEIVLDGLRRWVQRHATALEAAATQTADAVNRRELLVMAGVCRRVPEYPARTFREAVQSFYFQHLAVMFENPFGGNGPGRLDFYLWPWLQADLAAGRTTLAAARELMEELLIKLHERIAPGDGWVEAVPIGGRDRRGRSAINPLSYIVLETITELRQTHPSVYVRLPDDAPQDFIDGTVKYILAGGNRAQVYGDDAMIAALQADGVRLPDARNWTAGGCMEVSPQGCNCDLLFSFAHNVVRTMELVLNGGCLLQNGERAIPHKRTLAEYTSFEELYADFEQELWRELDILLRRLDIYLDAYAQFRPSYLLSSMVHDCLERGCNLNAGGARYTDYGGSGVGIPNVGDSLFAIRQAVFEERKFSGAQVLDALRADFVGHEGLRAYLLSLPKYGQDQPEADAMTDRVLRSFADKIKAHRNRYGGHARPIILGFVWVVSHGQESGATPDGRRSGQPLAHGLAPQSGAAVRGITAALNSATRLSLTEVGGGAAMMWDLDSAWATSQVVKPLLMTYVEKGGHIFQGNVTNVAEMVAAQADPDRYRDLVVRVGGWSARFVTLGKATQDEIIARRKYRG